VADEVTWHLALATVLVAALVDDVLSFGATIVMLRGGKLEGAGPPGPREKRDPRARRSSPRPPQKKLRLTFADC
jgi:hypothetical protein